MKTWLHHIWAKITAPRPYPVVPEDHHPVVDTPPVVSPDHIPDYSHPQYIAGFTEGHRKGRLRSDKAAAAIDQEYRSLIEDHLCTLRGLLGLRTLASGSVHNFVLAGNLLTRVCTEVQDYGLTLPEIERLAILVEEAGETLQQAGKVLRYGYVNRDGTGRVCNNRADLTTEVGDLVNSLNQLQRAGDIDSQQVLARTEKKAEQIKNWTHYQGNEHG